MSCPLVIVGMSGGVDSSVTAWLLQQQGCDVQGLFMSNWDEDESGYCTAAQDFQDARRVCEQLGIPLHKVSFAGEYRDRVFAYFLEEYRAGRTPNPDVLCNREIKFGVCFDYARRLGAEWVATGHYARVEHGPQPRLLKGLDPDKDQSYFLHAMPARRSRGRCFRSARCARTRCARSRAISTLPVFDKKDSTGICFIGERPFAAVPVAILAGAARRHRIALKAAGSDATGTDVLHARSASGSRHRRRARVLRRAVVRCGQGSRANVLVVVQGHDHPALFASDLVAEQLTWIAAAPPAASFRCTAKVRYRQADQACEVHVRQDGAAKCDSTFRSALSRRGNTSFSTRARSAWAAES